MAKITFKGTPIHTSGNLPPIGHKAPDFILVDGDLKDRSLKDFKGKKKVLSTNPSLDTSVCALTAKHFYDALKEDFSSLLIVITADLPFAQKRFCQAQKIENSSFLSMMRSKDFAKDYGILIEDGPLKGLCARSVIVLDEHDKVIYAELVPEITHEPNYDAVLKAL